MKQVVKLLLLTFFLSCRFKEMYSKVALSYEKVPQVINQCQWFQKSFARGNEVRSLQDFFSNKIIAKSVIITNEMPGDVQIWPL